MIFRFIELKYIWFPLLLLILGNKLFAQKDIYTKQGLEDIIESLAGSLDEDVDYTSLYDDLIYYLNYPLNLNIATTEDLEKLQFLNDFQVKSLLDYISTNGKMLSVYELQLVFGISEQDIVNILPFVTISVVMNKKSFKIKTALKYGNNQLFLRSQKVIEEQVGYSSVSDSALLTNPNSRYLGNEYKIYAKYKYNYKNKILAGFTAEKDPGEEFFIGSNENGFDYYSAHLQINDIGIIKTLCLGDYQAKFGQGLILWSDLGFGKSSDVLNVRKRAQGLVKYSSSNENTFMRGVGTTININKIQVSVFYSQKYIDANISDSLNNEIYEVSSLQNSGKHSIPSEIIDENAIKEQIIGGNLSFNHSNFKLGLTALSYQYSANLKKNITIENQFDFRGKENSNLSFDYTFGFLNFNLYGEEAICQSGGTAFLNGMLIHLAPQISLSALHRYYNRNFHSNYGNAFAESAENSNETGLYFGMEIHPIKYWKISAYYDNYKFQWLKSNIDAPSSGYDWLVQIEFIPTNTLSMYLKVKSEEKQHNETSLSGIKEITNKQNLKIRLHINSQVNDQLTLKSRVETSRFSEEIQTGEYGYLVYQDVFYDFRKAPLSINIRYAIFETDSYDSRIYAYESDILYAFSIPAYYSKGTRTYLNLKYSINNFIDIWLRYSQTYYSNKKVISSGLNQINGNVKSEIKAQVRINF